MAAMVENLTGKLVFRSMVFKKPKPRVLLHFVNSAKVDMFVEVESDMMPELVLGNQYHLTSLQVRSQELKDDTVTKFLLRPTETTNCFLLPTALCEVPEYSNFTSYQGTVTEVFLPLCMYQLDGKIWLCLAYIWGRVAFTPPVLGARVKVCNAHKVDDYLVLCERSCFFITQPDGNDGNDGNDGEVARPLQWLVENLELGFTDVLWLRSQYKVLETKFKSMLSALTLPDRPEAIDLMLVNIARKQQQVVPCTKVLKAVFLDHDRQCYVDKQGMLSGELCTIAQLAGGQVALAAEHQVWSGIKTTVGTLPGQLPLVAQLTTGSRYLRVTDDTGSMPLVLSGDIRGNIPDVVGFVVVVPVFVQISEHFKGSRELRYLQVRLQDVETVIDVRRLRPVVGAVCPDCRYITVTDHVCLGPDSSTSYFHLLHNSMISRHNSVEPPYCYLFGRVTDRYGRQAGVCDSSVVCLLLEADMYPLGLVLSVGATYKMRLGAGKKLDNVQVFLFNHHAPDCTIDTSTAFKLSQDVLFKFFTFTDSPWKTVKECLQMSDDTSKVHSVKGVIVTRRHQEPFFPSEKLTIGVEGYGIPGPLQMVLTLRDEDGPPEQEISVFVKGWKQVSYPLGILQGATVVCQRVHKKRSKEGSVYLFTDAYTRLGVL